MSEFVFSRSLRMYCKALLLALVGAAFFVAATAQTTGKPLVSKLLYMDGNGGVCLIAIRTTCNIEDTWVYGSISMTTVTSS